MSTPAPRSTGMITPGTIPSTTTTTAGTARTSRGIGDGSAVGSASLGLLGMKERVYSYGGTVEIRGAPACGTTVDVSIPLEEPQSR